MSVCWWGGEVQRGVVERGWLGQLPDEEGSKPDCNSAARNLPLPNAQPSLPRAGDRSSEPGICTSPLTLIKNVLQNERKAASVAGNCCANVILPPSC